MKVVPEAGGEEQSRECLFVLCCNSGNSDEIQIYKSMGREGWVKRTVLPSLFYLAKIAYVWSATAGQQGFKLCKFSAGFRF